MSDRWEPDYSTARRVPPRPTSAASSTSTSRSADHLPRRAARRPGWFWTADRSGHDGHRCPAVGRALVLARRSVQHHLRRDPRHRRPGPHPSAARPDAGRSAGWPHHGGVHLRLPGSPLGGYDRELQSQRPLLDELGIVPPAGRQRGARRHRGVRQPARPPPSPATGTTACSASGTASRPGVDRAGDAIRHGNFAGTARLGGVLADR